MKRVVHVGMVCLMILIIAPVYITLLYSFMGVREIELGIGGILNGYDKMAAVSVLPSYPTIGNYRELMLYSEKFYKMFWNSCIQTIPTVFLQILIAAPAAFVMARYQFRGKQCLFWLYLIVMLMPFQVVMVSDYLVLKRLSLLDTHLAIILPGIFSAYPVFILTKVLQTIPEECMEAARLDGANELVLLLKIGIPIGKGGIISVSVLGFLEFFQAIESPLIFLRNRDLWPLSLFFPEVSLSNAGEVFAASVVIMIPALLVFLLGDEYLEAGVKAIGIKN